MATTSIEQAVENIKTLPPVKMQEVFDFIDFLKQKQSQKTPVALPKRQAGSLKGKISMSDDFDAPLDDFKPSKAQLLSVLDDMAGCVSLPDDFDMKAEKLVRLEEKYLNG